MPDEPSQRQNMPPVRRRTTASMLGAVWSPQIPSILALGLVAIILVHKGFDQWSDPKTVVLLGDETAARRHNAEDVMKKALHMASKYEAKANAQKRLEAKDEELHLELVKAARDRAEVLKEEDAKEQKVEGVRMHLEQQLDATRGVLRMHEHRLENLMAERRESEQDAVAEDGAIKSLEVSKQAMGKSLADLKTKVDNMEEGLKKEEKEAQKTHASTTLERMLDLYLKKNAKEEARAESAERKASQAESKAKSKQEHALELQKQADQIKKEVDGMCSDPKQKCDQEKKDSLIDQEAAVRKQIRTLQQERVYEDKRDRVMHRTAALQQQLAQTDHFKAAEYRAKLSDYQRHLQALKQQIAMAPQQISVADQNLALARQAEEKVEEQLRLKRLNLHTDLAKQDKDQALARLQAKQIAKIRGLQKAEGSAAAEAGKEEAWQARVVSQESAHVQRLVDQSRKLREAAVKRREVAATWDSAETAELREASAYGKVVRKLRGATQYRDMAQTSSEEASQMQHGLQLLQVKEAIREYDRDPSPQNRARLRRLELVLEHRLGRADDAEENEAGIEELDTIEDTLQHLDGQGPSHPTGRAGGEPRSRGEVGRGQEGGGDSRGREPAWGAEEGLVPRAASRGLREGRGDQLEEGLRPGSDWHRDRDRDGEQPEAPSWGRALADSPSPR